MASSIGRYGNPAISSYVIDADGYFVATNVEVALAEIYERFSDADNVYLDQLGAPTYRSVQDWVDVTQSAGKFTDNVITAHAPADGTVDIAAGSGFIRTSAASGIGEVLFFDWEAVDGLALTNNDANYVFVDYNVATGAVTIQVTTNRATIDGRTEFTLGRIWRDNNDTHIINSGTQLQEHVHLSHERLIEVRGFEHAEGGTIAEVGTRELSSTAGVFYLGYNRITTPAQNTTPAGGDTFMYWYRDGVGGWTRTLGNTQIDNQNYDANNAAGPQALTANRYGVFWVYIDMDGHIIVLYGQGDYTLANAEAASPPASIPDFCSEFCILAAKLWIQKAAAAFTDIVSAYITYFPTTNPVAHNDLGAIQGGQVAEYYHLTAAQHTELTSWLDDVVLSTTGQVQINSVGAGTQNVIGITPQGALAGAGTVWKGLYIDCAALDPGVANIDIYGIHIDMTGVAMGTGPDIWGINVQLPAAYDAGTEIAGYFAGDGRTVSLCDDTYAVNTSGACNLVGALTGVTSLAMGGALSGVTTLSMSGQLTNTLAIGTPPFVITSTTVVPNLNVDRVDGHHMDQDVLQASSPTFVGLTLSGAIATPTTITTSGAINCGGLLTADGAVPEGDLADSLGTAALTWLNLYVQDIRDAAGNIIISNDGAGDIDQLGSVAPADGEVLTWVAANTRWEPTGAGAVAVAFRTITGITNDVVADLPADTLTLSSANAILTIVGTAATDTIAFTIVEAQISHDNIGGVSADDHHAQSHTIVSHSDATLAAPGSDQIVFWDHSDLKFEFLVANTGLSIAGNNLNCDITQYTNALAQAACVSDVAYGAGWNAVVDVAPSKNAVYDKIAAMDILIAANTTVVEVEAVITAELVNGQSIDNAIDALINTHNVANRHIDHTTVSVIAGTGLSGGGTIAADRTIDCDITQYTNAMALAHIVGQNPLTLTNNLVVTGGDITAGISDNPTVLLKDNKSGDAAYWNAANRVLATISSWTADVSGGGQGVLSQIEFRAAQIGSTAPRGEIALMTKDGTSAAWVDGLKIDRFGNTILAGSLTVSGAGPHTFNGRLEGESVWAINPSDATEALRMEYDHANDRGRIYAYNSGTPAYKPVYTDFKFIVGDELTVLGGNIRGGVVGDTNNTLSLSAGGQTADSAYISIHGHSHANVGNIHMVLNHATGASEFRIYDYDGAAAWTVIFVCDQSGNVQIDGNLTVSGDTVQGAIAMNLIAPTGSMVIRADGTGQHMYFDAGGSFYWRDEDAARNVVASLVSSTGRLLLGYAANTADPLEILRFNTERAWSFRKRSTGASTRLCLESDTGGKYFWIGHDDGVAWACKFLSDPVQANCKVDVSQLHVAGTSVITAARAIQNVTNFTLSGSISGGTTFSCGGANFDIDAGGNIVDCGNIAMGGALSGVTTIVTSGNVTCGGQLRVNAQDIRCASTTAQLRSDAGGTNKVTMVYASSEADLTANCSGSSSISAHHIYYDLITASSSERIKSGIVELDYMALAKQLDNVRPKEFYRRKSKVKEIGFIAEDLPQMVQCRNEKGEVVGYDTIAFITSLYSKILSQDKAMLKLKERLERLEDAS